MDSLKKNYPRPTKLGKAIKLVARMGGYLDRKSDPPPGHQVIYKGYQQLQIICEGVAYANPSFSQKDNYG